MKINQLKLGSLLTYAQMALSIGINLVYTPIMIRCLGQSEYGLYQTALSVISMMSVLNLGFSNSYIRYYSKYWGALVNKTDKISTLMEITFY